MVALDSEHLIMCRDLQFEFRGTLVFLKLDSPLFPRQRRDGASYRFPLGDTESRLS